MTYPIRSPFILSIALLALTACEQAANPEQSANQNAAIENATVSLGGADESNLSQRLISWDGASEVDIAVGQTPDGSDAKLIAEDVTGANFTFDKAEPGQRYYFTLTADGQEPITTALRLLPLEGGRNFRDMGGYTTADGRTVKWGTLFRSGTMYKLTTDDYRYLGNLGIQVVCDLRSNAERESEPTKWAAGDTEYRSFDYGMEMGGGLMQLFQKEGITPEEVSEAMAGSYREIAYEHASRYIEIFDELAKGRTPLAFNCSAGKDRAGTAAALILAALGVSEEKIIEDYSLSEKYVDYMAEFKESGEEDPDGPVAFLSKLPEELVAPLMRSDPKYIRTAFAQIKKDHGSVLNFIQTELGVDDAELEAIRNRLLS